MDFIDHANPTEPEDFPFILVGNKNDLDSLIPEEDVEAWCTSNKVKRKYQTSATEGTQVEEVF